MRYVIFTFALIVFVVMVAAGKRGEISRKPPIELFPDMDRQPKVRPQTTDNFFKDGLSTRLPVDGTVARGSNYEDSPVNTGKTASGEWILNIPVPVTESLMARGRERYTIYCAPCHGAAGDGKGITTKYGMTVIADLHDHKLRKLLAMPDGEIFNTISNGKLLMGAYAGAITIEDRWAIIAYVRALQRSRLALIEDVPQELRASLKK